MFTYYNGTIRVPEELIDEKPLNHPQYMASQLGQKTRVSLEEFCGLWIDLSLIIISFKYPSRLPYYVISAFEM